MGAYTELQDAVYNSVSAMFPQSEVIWMYEGGTEPTSPYIGLYILDLEQIGREEVSTFAEETSTGSNQYRINIKVTYEAQVQVHFRGSGAGDLAHEFNQTLNNPLFWEVARENNLSKMRKSSLRNSPQQRETKWVQGYNQDVTFAYCYLTEQIVDTIDQVIIVNTTTGDRYFVPATIG